MTTKRKRLWLGIGCIVVFAFGIAAYGVWTFLAPNDLGLTRMDLAIEGSTDVEMFRTKTKAVADAHLAQFITAVLPKSITLPLYPAAGEG